MRPRMMANAMALLLIAGSVSGALAADRRNAHHWRHGHHVARSYVGQNTSIYDGRRPYTDLGPLGFSFAPLGRCGSSCPPGASISAWSY